LLIDESPSPHARNSRRTLERRTLKRLTPKRFAFTLKIFIHMWKITVASDSISRPCARYISLYCIVLYCIEKQANDTYTVYHPAK